MSKTYNVVVLPGDGIGASWLSEVHVVAEGLRC